MFLENISIKKKFRTVAAFKKRLVILSKYCKQKGIFTILTEKKLCTKYIFQARICHKSLFKFKLLPLQRKPWNRPKINFVSIRRRQFLCVCVRTRLSPAVSLQSLDRIQFSNAHFFCFLMRIMRLKKFLGLFSILAIFGPFFRFQFFLNLSFFFVFQIFNNVR